MRFDERVVIVTGAARGIGRAEALLLAERGASVVVNDLGTSVVGAGADAGVADDVAAEIRSAGGSAVANADSVATSGGADALIRCALDAFGRIDAVVNNAGVRDLAVFPDADADAVTRLLDVHLLGAYNVTRAAWQHLLEHGAGRVVMTTSTTGLYGQPTGQGYAAAKGGVVGLTRGLASIAEPLGIRVNAIAPGAYSRMVETRKDEQFKRFSEEQRGPEHVAPIVALLAHESCPVNGEVFTASAGRVAHVFTAETRGFCRPGHTPETLLANWGEVVDQNGYYVPRDAGENLRITLARLREAGASVPDFELAELARAGISARR